MTSYETGDSFPIGDDGQPAREALNVELEPEKSEKPNYARTKRRALFGFLFLGLVQGVLAGLLADDQRLVDLLGFVLNIASVFCLLAWFRADARSRSFHFGRGWGAAIFFLTLIAAPVYFFKTRGLRGFVSISYAFLFTIAAVILQLGVMALILELRGRL